MVAISILLESDKTYFVGVFEITDYESKFMNKNKYWRI